VQEVRSTFGTIGRYRPKPGHEEQLRALTEEWDRTMRPTIPGLVAGVRGRPAGRPGEMISVILTQDEATYRAFANNPEQDAWYRRLVEHLETEPTWEDVAWEGVRIDASRSPGG
jgi:hypothetical protein